MKTIWLNVYDAIPNTSREIWFSFKISTLIYYKQIQVEFWKFKPTGMRSVGI